MKNKTFLLFAAIIVLLFPRCGKDGVAGNCYISLNDPTGYYVQNSFTGSNPNLAYVHFNTNYLTSPGTYSYSYGVWTDFTETAYYPYSGTYILDVNDGTKGGCLHSGTNGADKYYTFNTTYNSPTLTSVRKKKDGTILNVTNDLVSEKINPDGSFERIYDDGNYRFTINGTKGQLIKVNQPTNKAYSSQAVDKNETTILKTK